MKVASLKVLSSWRFRQRKAYSMLVSTKGAGIADEMLMKSDEICCLPSILAISCKYAITSAGNSNVIPLFYLILDVLSSPSFLNSFEVWPLTKWKINLKYFTLALCLMPIGSFRKSGMDPWWETYDLNGKPKLWLPIFGCSKFLVV